MPSWNTDLYLKYANERTQPAIDLAAHVNLESPRRVIDLGCGPGNSTAVLARRWPRATPTGLDNSAAMLTAARKSYPSWTWVEADIATWQAPIEAPFDLVFSNAAMQWVPNHARIFPRLLTQVAPGGALAVQVPANYDAPPHRIMRELGSSSGWRHHFVTPPREWHVNGPEFYYDTLAPYAKRLELWTTDYLHVLSSVDDVVEWYRGTGLRPWLEALPDEATRARFLVEYRAALAPHFPPRSDGRVFFAFHRLFLIAYR